MTVAPTTTAVEPSIWATMGQGISDAATWVADGAVKVAKIVAEFFVGIWQNIVNNPTHVITAAVTGAIAVVLTLLGVHFFCPPPKGDGGDSGSKTREPEPS